MTSRMLGRSAAAAMPPTASPATAIQLQSHLPGMGILFLLGAQVLVEPVGERDQILLEHAGPAMRRLLLPDQPGWDVLFLALRDEALGLLEGDDRVGVAVRNYCRRRRGADVLDRRDLVTQLEPLLGRVPLQAKRGPESLEHAHSDGVLAGLAVVEEVGRRAEAGHALHRA